MDKYESVATAPYESRCKLLNLDKRRKISSVMFVRDVLSARINSPSLLGMLALTANTHRTRSRALLLERFNRTAYASELSYSKF
jgi:hypothetical protein